MPTPCCLQWLSAGTKFCWHSLNWRMMTAVAKALFSQKSLHLFSGHPLKSWKSLCAVANQIFICLVKIIRCREQGILHIHRKSEYSLLHLVISPSANLSLLQQSVLVFQCATSSQWAQDCNYHTWEAKTETEADTGISGLHSEICLKIKMQFFSLPPLPPVKFMTIHSVQLLAVLGICWGSWIGI